MSESENETPSEDGTGIGDDQLPEDLQPSEDNPLAEPLPEEDRPEDPAELDMQGGKAPEESGDDGESADDGDDD
ncbi:MAG: hypothetical protein ACRDOM_10255 [Nocardioides sp.]